jgi:hypothetical protein
MCYSSLHLWHHYRTEACTPFESFGFASYWNVLHHSTEHVWQGRYYSCLLDEPRLVQRGCSLWSGLDRSMADDALVGCLSGCRHNRVPIDSHSSYYLCWLPAGLTGVHPHAGKRNQTPPGAQKRGPRKKADRSENQETFSFGMPGDGTEDTPFPNSIPQGRLSLARFSRRL